MWQDFINTLSVLWPQFLTALALVFILEGIMPFVNPNALRKMFAMALQMNDKTLRFVGLSSMILGLILLYIVH